MKKVLVIAAVLGLAAICAPEMLLAQPPPPAFPANPSQAPIDGGLTAVALGAGAWAMNKLRKVKKS